MNLIFMILYGAGVIGIIISLVLTFISINKHKISFAIIGVTSILSLSLIGTGTFFTLKSINSANLNKTASTKDSTNSSTKASTTSTSNSQNNKIASINDLTFKCDFNDANESEKSAYITITNNSDSEFNGKVKLNFTDSSGNTTNTMEVPIDNLMPSSSYSSNILVDKSTSKVDYSFSGSFNSVGNEDTSYTINKTLIGNNSYMFDVSVKDTSYSNLQKISKQFTNEYTLNVCSSFLIYFYPSDKGSDFNINEAIGDFSRDYSDNTSKLTVYNQ